jgi:UDP-N-acetylmuramoylalanine--D-glutamate ligase
MKHLAGLNVLVLGLGASGLAMARWCAAHGAQVTVWDSRDEPPGEKALREELPEVKLTKGKLDAQAVQRVQLLLKSPGLSPSDPHILDSLSSARSAGIAVQGELDLFVRALADLKAERRYAPQVVAITGTNGKTTTTALAALLIERAGKRVVSAGNIGPTLLDTLAAALADELPEVWVLELSSFQLDGVMGFDPDAAAILNLSQDHLDWHGDMVAYAAAKARIWGATTRIVSNRDDAQVEALIPKPLPVKGSRAAPKPRSVVRFGLDAPRAPGDFGLVTEAGMAWLVRAQEAEVSSRRRKDEPPDELLLQRLMPADALRIRGRHNAANALAALALASAIGCPLAPMLHGLREYEGEPHRVQLIGRVNGIDAYDDSKGTNVGATVAALNGLGADVAPGKLIVILGGDGKGQDFAPLAEPVVRHARAVALIGRDADAMAAALAATGLPQQKHATLEAATAWCFEQAHAGDAVLLSPACASLDMFRNYAHRAEVFVAAVQHQAAEAGVTL